MKIMKIMKKINKKIDVSILQTISNSFLGIISMAMLVCAIINAPENIRILLIIGQVISFIGVVFFSIKIKSLKSDRDVVFTKKIKKV